MRKQHAVVFFADYFFPSGFGASVDIRLMVQQVLTESMPPRTTQAEKELLKLVVRCAQCLGSLITPLTCLAIDNAQWDRYCLDQALSIAWDSLRNPLDGSQEDDGVGTLENLAENMHEEPSITFLSSAVSCVFQAQSLCDYSLADLIAFRQKWIRSRIIVAPFGDLHNDASMTHWMLLVYRRDTAANDQFTLYDSFRRGSTHIAHAKKLARVLSAVLTHGSELSEPTIQVAVTQFQQQDGWSCGPAVCAWMSAIAHGRDILSVTQDQVDAIRPLLSSLFEQHGRALGDYSVPLQDIESLRSDDRFWFGVQLVDYFTEHLRGIDADGSDSPNVLSEDDAEPETHGLLPKKRGELDELEGGGPACKRICSDLDTMVLPYNDGMLAPSYDFLLSNCIPWIVSSPINQILGKDGVVQDLFGAQVFWNSWTCLMCPLNVLDAFLLFVEPIEDPEQYRKVLFLRLDRLDLKPEPGAGASLLSCFANMMQLPLEELRQTIAKLTLNDGEDFEFLGEGSEVSDSTCCISLLCVEYNVGIGIITGLVGANSVWHLVHVPQDARRTFWFAMGADGNFYSLRRRVLGWCFPAIARSSEARMDQISDCERRVRERRLDVDLVERNLAISLLSGHDLQVFFTWIYRDWSVENDVEWIVRPSPLEMRLAITLGLSAKKCPCGVLLVVRHGVLLCPRPGCSKDHQHDFHLLQCKQCRCSQFPTLSWMCLCSKGSVSLVPLLQLALDPHDPTMLLEGIIGPLQDIYFRSFDGSSDLLKMIVPSATSFEEAEVRDARADFEQKLNASYPDLQCRDPAKVLTSSDATFGPVSRDSDLAIASVTLLNAIQSAQGRKFLIESVQRGELLFTPALSSLFEPDIASTVVAHRAELVAFVPTIHRPAANQEQSLKLIALGRNAGQMMPSSLILEVSQSLFLVSFEEASKREKNGLFTRLFGKVPSKARLAELGRAFDTVLEEQGNVPLVQIAQAPVVLRCQSGPDFVNVLVLQEKLVNIETRKCVSWIDVGVAISDPKGSVLLPLNEGQFVVSDDVRNAYLASVWNVYGRRACMLVACIMSQLACVALSSLRGHQGAAVFVKGPTCMYKTSILTEVLKAFGCLKVFGELAQNAEVKAALASQLMVLFDDIGKGPKSKVKLDVDHLKVLVADAVNGGAAKTSSCLILATFNDDNFAKFKDDAEGTACSRILVAHYTGEREKTYTGSERIISLSASESDLLMASLVSLPLEPLLTGICDRFLQSRGLSGREQERQRNLLTANMTYFVPIWSSFLTSIGNSGCALTETMSFVSTHFVEPQINLAAMKLVDTSGKEVFRLDTATMHLRDFILQYHKVLEYRVVEGRGQAETPICLRYNSSTDTVSSWDPRGGYMSKFAKANFIVEKSKRPGRSYGKRFKGLPHDQRVSVYWVDLAKLHIDPEIAFFQQV